MRVVSGAARAVLILATMLGVAAILDQAGSMAQQSMPPMQTPSIVIAPHPGASPTCPGGYVKADGTGCGTPTGGGTINPAAPNLLAGYPGPGTQSLIGGFSSFLLSGPIGGAGVTDTNRPWVNTSSITTGVNGATDECARLQQLSVNADTAGWAINQFMSAPAVLGVQNLTVYCAVQQFFDPALFNESGSQPYTSSNTMLLGASTYNVLGEVDVPALSTLQGRGGGSSVSEGLAVTQLEAATTSLSSISGASGGTLSVSNGQTCTLGSFNNGLSGAAAKVTFAASNSWAGAVFTITNAGSGATAPPTTATLSSGTGTCSGTAALSATIGALFAPYGASYPSVGVNLGPPLANLTNGAVSLAAIVRDLTYNANGAPNVTCFANYLSQQGTSGTDIGCRGGATGLDISGLSGFTGAGSSQNTWNFDNDSWTEGNGPTSQGVDNVYISAGGSYTQCPAVTFSGCSTEPTAAAICSGGAVTGLIPEWPNWQGSGCPATGVSIAFASTYGSGAAATPFIGTTRPIVGVATGDISGGGSVTLKNHSAVAATTTNQPKVGYQVDTSQFLSDALYCESLQNCVKVGSQTSGVIGLISLRRVVDSNAQGPCYADAELFNTAKIEAIDVEELGGGCAWFLRDDASNGGDVPYSAYELEGLPFYARGHWFVTATTGEIATNTPHSSSYYNCNTGSDSGCLLPLQYAPLMAINGHISGMNGSDSSTQPIGLGLNGRFDQTSTDSISPVTDGPGYCIMDMSVQPVAGDAVTVSPNNTLNGNTEAGCLDMQAVSPTGNIIGNIIALGSNGSLTIPSTPTGGSVVQVGTGSNISATYEVETATLQDKSLSAPETLTTTTGPQELYKSAYNNLTGLGGTATNPVKVWRTALGDSLPSLTVNCCTNGGITSLSGLPGGTGVTFCPTVSFSGGSCTTTPVATPQCSGGQVVGVYWKTHGAGCSGSMTATLTASTQRLGYIGFSTGSTLADQGLPGDGTTPPASGQVAPMIQVNVHNNPGPLAINSAAVNLVPDTGFKQGLGGYWTASSGITIVAGADPNPNLGGNGLVYTGTGSASGQIQASAFKVHLISGDYYSLSAAANTLNLTSGTVGFRVCSTPTCGATNYGAVGPFGALNSAWQAVNFQASATVDAYFVFTLNNITVPLGQTISFGEPMVGKVTNGTSLLTYVANDGPGQGDASSGIRSGIAPQFAAVAAASGEDCLQVDASGNVSNTGSSCGSSSGGVQFTVNGGSALGSPVNMQNSTGAGGTTATNPSGNNVQVTLNNTATTPNGQTCTLGSACNVNNGAAAHSVALNEGAGNAIGGAAIGTGGRMLLDQGAGTDPAFEAMSGDCSLSITGAIVCTKINGNTPGGSCTNQFVASISGSAVPTCATVVAADTDSSIAHTGADINASNQVTSTHLSAALPTAQGGTGNGSLTFPSGTATIPQKIASGQTTLGTSLIASGTCASVISVAATGVSTTDVIQASASGDWSGIVGYEPATTGMLTILPPYPTSGYVNFKVCNNTAAAITPGAVTVNWQVIR